MNKQIIAIVVLVSIALVLGLGAILFNGRRGSILLPTTNVAPSPNLPAINIALAPEHIDATVGGRFSVDIMPRNIQGKVTGLDLLLTIDPSLIAFEELENIPEGYIKGRALTDDNTLIVSIIESISTTQTATATPKRLGTMVFSAKKAGTGTIAPIINRHAPKTSMLLLGDSLENALTGVTKLKVTIHRSP